MNNNWRSLWIAVAIATGYALLLRIIFGLSILHNFTTVMTLSFFITVPYAMGYLTIIFSSVKSARSVAYRIFAPWLPVFVLLLLTMMLSIEGWLCWLMILPIFLIFASIGGLVAGSRKIRRHDRRDRLQLSLVALLPFVFCPLEKQLPVIPARFEAYTYTDIHASAAMIWAHVLRVETIPQKADHGSLTRFLGLPRPIRAELNYAGVGGSRQAIFSKGLIFQEVVSAYEDQKKMSFSIKADPRSIPPTTMDEHVVVGGEYFDVLDGTYALEKLGDDEYRLHLYSHYTFRTTFNWYAGLWGKLIMKDIQNNILRVIKTRCETKLL